MESLKLLQELSSMGESLKIETLRHFFKYFDPSTSRALAQTITHFRIKELESADYRSAYGQLSDWIYGWTVQDVTEFGDDSVLDHFQTKRPPREIDLRNDREKGEAERIMKTYEVLHQMTRRILNKFYVDIDEEMPRIGQGLSTFKNGQVDEKENFDDEQDFEKVWATKSVDDLDNQARSRELLLDDDDDLIDEISIKKGMTVRRASFMERSESLANDVDGRDADQKALKATEETEEDDGNEVAEDEPEEGSVHSDEPSKIESNTAINANLPGSFQFLSTPIQQDMSNTMDMQQVSQKDINHIYVEIDKCTDYTIIAISNLMVILSISELLNDKATYLKYSAYAHELSMDFVSNTLKAIWDLLNKELPGHVTLADLRSPNLLRLKIRKILELRRKDGKIPKFKIRKIHFKFALLHEMFTMMDIFIFPNFVAAHKDGLKATQSSNYDTSLWLTGGNDCLIKIHDVRATSAHICLAQYVGHKSVITSVMFNSEETYIVSSSFDRTLKIWNSQNGTCERTLIGHTDAVLSCALSPDGRYIVSGSTDNSIRVWEFSTGDCLNVIRKHTKWVKAVKFSQDGRYIASASLDRRVMIWDLKFLLNSKSPTPFRSFDDHQDYVLDIAIHKNLLLTTCRDSKIRIFDYINGVILRVHNLAPSWACTVSFSDNGEYLATGSFDNNLMIFKTSDLSVIRQIRVFNFGIMTVKFPKDLSFVIVGSTEGFLQQIPL